MNKNEAQTKPLKGVINLITSNKYDYIKGYFAIKGASNGKCLGIVEDRLHPKDYIIKTLEIVHEALNMNCNINVITFNEKIITLLHSQCKIFNVELNMIIAQKDIAVQHFDYSEVIKFLREVY